MRSLAIRSMGAGLVLAALSVGVAAPAGASDSPNRFAQTVAPAQVTIHHVTGSENLDKVANALAVYSKSVSAVVRVPAGLQLSQPVEIETSYGEFVAGRTTQMYSQSRGNVFSHNFDAGDGTARREPVTIVLRERDPITNSIVKSFTIHAGANVLALWDVRVYPLQITFWQSCDLLSNADPHVLWSDVEGKLHTAAFDPDLGETVMVVDGFWGIWHEAKVSDHLLQPEFSWSEADPGEYNPTRAVVPTVPLLPTKGYHKQLVIEESGGDCDAHFAYSVYTTLRTYPNLPNG